LDWHDVMTYCDQEWLSPYTYQAIRSRLLAESEIVIDLGRQGPRGTSYLVQVSTDNGRSWRTAGVGLRTPRVAVDRRTMVRGRALLIRVTATDGFTSTVVADETVHD
jgi:hypothetical protein